MVFTRKRGVIINKAAKLKPNAYGALLNTLQKVKRFHVHQTRRRRIQ